MSALAAGRAPILPFYVASHILFVCWPAAYLIEKHGSGRRVERHSKDYETFRENRSLTVPLCMTTSYYKRPETA